MTQSILKILIIEDDTSRQDVLINLCKKHAWILVSTAKRAEKLISSYKFDLIFLDYDLAGPDKGNYVAKAIAVSPNKKCKLIIHSMNAPGAQKIQQIIPQAKYVPFSKIIKSNAVFKRLKQELDKGVNIDWPSVFGKRT